MDPLVDQGRPEVLASRRLGAVHSVVMDELNRRGWVSFPGVLQDVAEAAAHWGWEASPVRRGDPVVSDLRPTPPSAARPNSMSARTGMGAQPLHTDGAHLRRPPDFIALAAGHAHPVPTRLFAPRPSNEPWESLSHGVFLVSSGRVRFHALAFQEERLRFDPCCMTACDQRSRRVVACFTGEVAGSATHNWSSDLPEVLLIDNRRVLHAREAVSPSDPPRLLRRMAFRRVETT